MMILQIAVVLIIMYAVIAHAEMKIKTTTRQQKI